MSETFVARNSTVKLGGISAICAGLALLGATFYSLTLIRPGGGFMDDLVPFLLSISRNMGAYKWLLVLYFLAQVFLMPVPYAAYCWLRANSTVRGGLLPLSAVFGIASCIVATIGITVLFAAVPILAGAVAKGTPQGDGVLLTASIALETGNMLRLFSEVLLAGWLIVMGMAMWPAHTKWSAAGVLVLGLYTLMATIIKIYSPLNPIENWLGLVLAIGYVFVGVGLVRAKFKI